MVASNKKLQLGQVFPRRVGSTAWTGGEIQITYCIASKQFVIRQGDREIDVPIKRWLEIVELPNAIRQRHSDPAGRASPSSRA